MPRRVPYALACSLELRLDPLQTFSLDILYPDDKGEYLLQDEGEFKGTTPPGDALGLSFTSTVFGDKFTGAAENGFVGIKYDFDGDGQLDTVFEFQRVGE
jgi:hypothetical protein